MFYHPTQLTDLIPNDEKIILSKLENRFSPKTIPLTIFSVGFITSLIFIFQDIDIMLLCTFGFAFFAFTVYKEQIKNYEYDFIFTDKKLYTRKFVIAYSDIKRIDYFNHEKTLSIHRYPGNFMDNLELKNISIPNETFYDIKENWFATSIFKKINQRFSDFSTLHDLQLHTYDWAARLNIFMDGFLNDSRFGFYLYGMHQFIRLDITFHVSNEENNYLHIRPEKTSDSISKAFGMQDYQMGQKELDKALILKGNHIPFLEQVLNTEILMDLLPVLKKSKGTISMGTPQELREKALNQPTENDLLDDHLIPSHTPTLDAGKVSVLKFSSKHINYSSDLMKAVDDMIDLIQGLSALAQSIESYNRSTAGD